ncbi:HAMP domain-containing methyl-accepting chemotaxis protein [Metasolibacillus meyeri]|uniref:HAMP domain-containing methyl-accepting chemotaxis protein n=1 Tax=Metasolibacillus meyeri TaxID=1071052 RepID=A0AAW9NZN8_9BACL|nr:HAMP domain-containing methyl-accepting chemotaxis protein [Metasolibacillus meyeri]MEC1180623.1 HAMP domain-containing methyl-accepting chemotaxis protein [Metasolibacillus meyeri]
MQLITLKSSTEEIVDALVTVEELNSASKSLQKSLSAYALNISEGNKSDIEQDLHAIQTIHEQLMPTLTTDQQLIYAENISHKYKEIVTISTQAVNESDQAEIKRQSLRTKGLINDVIELKRSVSSQYANKQVELQKNIDGIAFISILLVVILLVGSIIFVYILTNRISKRIGKVSENAKEIADGNLAIHLEGASSKDEIGSLQDSFKHMAGNLQEILSHVHDSSSQVAASAEQLMASADMTMKGAEVITESMQHVSNGAEKQAIMSEESANSTQRSILAVNEITKNASLAQKLSISTSDKTRQGSNYVQETVSQMQRINESVRGTDTALIKLNNQTKEIVQVLHQITAVADQTNLLALNAAIEAARAGEAGKGFAVVADEVRKLAEQTRNLVSDITEVATQIEIDTEETVHSINDVKERVDTGLVIASDTQTTFEEILAAVEQVNTEVSNITTVSTNIENEVTQVSTHANEMLNLSKATSDNSNSVAATSEEQLASMEEIASAANSLANLAEELQTRVSKFTF